jgi:hypothetical protein
MILLLFCLFCEVFDSYRFNVYHLIKRIEKKVNHMQSIIEQVKVVSVSTLEANTEKDGELSKENNVPPAQKVDFALISKSTNNQFTNPMINNGEDGVELQTIASSKEDSREKSEEDQSTVVKIKSQSDPSISPFYNQMNKISSRMPIPVKLLQESKEKLKLGWKWYGIMIIGLFINVIVVLTVNMSFVSVSESDTISSSSKQLISFAVSIFKIIWNGVTMERFQSVLMSFLPKKNTIMVKQ